LKQLTREGEGMQCEAGCCEAGLHGSAEISGIAGFLRLQRELVRRCSLRYPMAYARLWNSAP
ncbi:MAG: hypothetical protein ACKON9_17325, partial [Planctomycetaceae bacterium]